MSQEERSSRNGGRKMHPLFIELYLAEQPDEGRKVTRRARQRRVIAQRRLARGA